MYRSDKRYETVLQLVAAYRREELREPMVLDNDTTDAYSNDRECVFSMHPDHLLRALLDYLDVPWEEC